MTLSSNEEAKHLLDAAVGKFGLGYQAYGRTVESASDELDPPESATVDNINQARKILAEGWGDFLTVIEEVASNLVDVSNYLVPDGGTGGGGGEPPAGTPMDVIEEHGIRIEFDRSMDVTRFVDDSPAAVGPITVTNITFPGGSGGWQVDPQTGWRGDARLQSYHPTIGKYTSPPSLPITLQPGQTLIVARHRQQGQLVNDPTGARVSTNHCFVESIQFLSALRAGETAVDHFRPCYMQGADSPIPVSRVDWSKLLREDIGGTPNFSYLESCTKRWLNQVCDWPARYSHPWTTQPNYYREANTVISEAAIAMMADVPVEEKRRLALNLIQIGIDTFGVSRIGNGDSDMSIYPVVFAAELLDDADMRAFRDGNQHGWKELTQCYRHSDGRALWEQDPGRSYMHKHPSQWTSSDMLQEKYRRGIVSPMWVGQAIAAQRQGLRSYYREEEFFDYVNFWMTENDEAIRVAIRDRANELHSPWDPPPQGGTMGNLVQEAWDRFGLSQQNPS